jgi:hypothetical protein
MREHLAALEGIARLNPFEGIPTPATGTPGHVASQNYVIEKMRAAGFNVTTQQFEADIFFEQAPAAFQRISPNPVTYQRYDGQNGVWYTADFSGDGDRTAPITVVDGARSARRTARTSSSRRSPATTPPACQWWAPTTRPAGRWSTSPPPAPSPSA